MKRICVYCGSYAGSDQTFVAATTEIGRLLAEHHMGVVYGGAGIGLMGTLADAYLAHGGQELIGVIPERFGLALSHPGLTETHVTQTMHQRKQMMFDLADGFLALARGMGTVEEFMEVLTWARHGEHGKPIGLLNTGGYYDSLLLFLDQMAASGFCSAADRRMLLDDRSPQSVLALMYAYKPPVIDQWWKRVEAGARQVFEAPRLRGDAIQEPKAQPDQPMPNGVQVASSPSGTIERFNPYLPEFIHNPYPIYAKYRAQDPVHWGLPSAPGVPGCWYVFRYDDALTVLRDRRFRRKWIPSTAKAAPRAVAKEQMAFLTMAEKWLLSSDPPDHTRLRALVSKAFSPRMLTALSARVQALADELVQELDQAESFDLIAGYAQPLSFTIIREILGVPKQDAALFQDWTAAVGAGINLRQGSEVIELASQSVLQMLDFFRRLIADRRLRPCADLISSLIEARDRDDQLNEEELLSMCIQLIFAGYETTVNLISNGTLALLRNPAQRDLILQQPELIGKAVNELLRFDGSVQTAAARKPSEDIELGGKLVRAGEPVIAFLGSANRDPSVFPDPDRLDITRSTSQHLAFGFGIHACLGAALARMEGEIAIGTLFRRFPRLRLKDVPLQWRSHAVLRGLERLPLSVS